MRSNLVAVVLAICPVAFAAAADSGIRAADGSHRIKLERFVAPPYGVAGVLVRARINGSPPMRLLLDSGAQYVVLNRAAAARTGCTGGSEMELVGAGDSSARSVKLQTAAGIEVGDLTFHNVPLLVADRVFADGIQGAMPLSMFADYLVQIDFPGKELRLSPYPASTDREGAVATLTSNQLLFVRGTANETRGGYFLLDTGSAYTAISSSLARQLDVSDALSEHVPLSGGTTNVHAALVTGAVRLRFSPRPFAGPIIAVDLSTISRYHNFNVVGLIGYNALSESLLTVNYRDGFIRLDGK
jgi:hypothetical protein